MFKVSPDMIYNCGYFNVEENRVITDKVILSIRSSFLSPEEKVVLQEETLICYINRPYDFSQIKEIIINGVHFKRFFRIFFDYIDYYFNKSRFINGYDLRNKYLHGTSSGHNNENEHYVNFLH